MLSEAERRELLRLARETIEARVWQRDFPSLPDLQVLLRPAGAFVTLTREGRLRGCIGYPDADRPLGQVVVRCAAAAAESDPRFAPVTSDELTVIHVEISVLGILEPISDPAAEIEIGRHGLIAELGARRGLLLPQVATDWSWDREMFLTQTCIKAGLRPDAWRSGAKLFRFEAEVFGET